MEERSCTVRKNMKAEPARVFAAMTEVKEIAAWSGQKGRVERTIGGKMEMFDGWVKGAVLAYAPGERLSFTWLPEEWEKGTQASVVVCTLEPFEGGTRVTVLHDGFPNEKEMKSHKAGWSEHYLDPLAEYLSHKP